MTAEASGFLGRFAANRPWLSTVLVAFAMTALCVVGVRRAGGAAGVGGAEYAGYVSSYLLNGLYVLGVPLGLAAVAPRRAGLRALIAGGAGVVAAGLWLAADRGVSLSPYLAAPPKTLTVAAVAFLAVLLAIEPFFKGAYRLGVAAPFAALLGSAGAAGLLAFEGLLHAPASAAALSVALAAGVVGGVGVGADYAGGFARGATGPAAASRGGHAGLAPAMFAILAVCVFFALYSWRANFGAVDWPVLWAAAAAALLTCVASLMLVAAALSVSQHSEQVAVDENRRREWFARVWAPVRRLVPAQTALAATAITGVLAVVAMFEAGLAAPGSFLVFLGGVWAAAALAFVSLRASLLIAALLFASAIFADYGYSLAGAAAPDLLARFTALTLAAIALAQLTVSWRDASDVWRNARDIAQNAMAGGLRRFLLALAAGAASLVVAAYSFAWPDGFGAAAYFLATGAISLVLAPVMMIALSAGTRPL